MKTMQWRSGYRDVSGACGKTPGPYADDALHFTAPGLSMRTGYAPLAANHSYSYASCLHAHPGLACPVPSIRDLMKNPG